MSLFFSHLRKMMKKKCKMFVFPIEKICTFGNDFEGSAEGKALGEMSEWFKEHAWKVCVLQKGTAGSNPALSAELL